MFTRADDLARQQETPAADSADDPDRNKKFPPTEKQMLDDDFFNAYGSDPDEHV